MDDLRPSQVESSDLLNRLLLVSSRQELDKLIETNRAVLTRSSLWNCIALLISAAVKRIGQIHVSILEERHLIGFLARDMAEVYSRLIQILVAMQNTSDAFEVVQRAKSRALLQLLSRSRFAPTGRFYKDAVAREQDLQSTMNAYIAMANQVTDEAERLHWSAKVTHVSSKLNDVWDVLYKSSEEYVDLRRAASLSMTDFQRLCSLSI